RLAGLEVYRLLAEPTAAALAYGLDKGGQGCFAVYDLGGGTFDISILRLRDGVFQVLATGGDSALGGDDFDRALATTLLAEAGVDMPSAAQISGAQASARRIKEALTAEESVHMEIDGLGVSRTVTRATFEGLIRPLVRRSIRACRKTLKDAGVSAPELDGVVLVGGSTRVPLVAEEVEDFFGRAPLADIDPDRVVALGAAIQADILSGNPRGDVTLLDVVPLSLGLETMGGIVEKIVPRNATIPIAARQVFTNYSEQQTAMSIHVVQGERELADDCRSLARFELEGIPRLPPSMARVEVTFQLDADALLTVTARELMTQVKQTVEVVPTYGLSEEEIEAMVEESYDYAGEDYEARSKAEARVELGRVVLAVQAAVSEFGEAPGSSDETLATEVAEAGGALADAQAAMESSDADAKQLNAARKLLEAASEPLARRRMEAALLAGMSGKTLAQVESSM
ncbi:MAG: Hsp70 family protein, partial [Nannocystaceae bacterium]